MNKISAATKIRPAVQPLTYTIIKSAAQYDSYCGILDYLNFIKKKTRDDRDRIELLSLLIEKWDRDQMQKLPETNPPGLLLHLMEKTNIGQSDLAAELGVSKSLVSDILNFRRGFSRSLTRKLVKRFRVSGELFNKPYKLKD